MIDTQNVSIPQGEAQRVDVATPTFTVPAGFNKVEGPSLFKFEKPGDELRGVFLQAKNVTINGDAAIEFYVKRAGNGGVVKFRPSYDLREKISRGMVGKELLIRYMKDVPEKGREGNAYKEFGVWLKDRAAVAPTDGDPGITDDDIPF